MDRVSRVIAALMAHDHIRILAKKIDDFSLAFIPPLAAYSDDYRHD